MRSKQPQKARFEGEARRPAGSLPAVLFAASLSVSVLGLAGTASAGSVGIQFDVSQSWISILGGAVVIPPDGNLTTDTFRVVVPGDSATDIQSGAAIVRDLGFDVLSLDADVLGVAQITGSIGVDQVGDAAGNLVLNGTQGTISLPFLLPSSGLQLAIDPNVGCIGGACSLIGSFPLTSPVTPILTGALSIANIGQNGGASFDQTFAITLSGITGVVKLVGQEIQRTFVPEPSSATLVWAGVFAATWVGRRAASLRGKRDEA